MALKKLERTFAPVSKEVRYLNKTFPEFRQSLIDFARVYYPDSYNDFNEASPGMMFIEMASYVGDVLSYYIDSQFKENLMEYAQETENVISIAQSFGYKPKPVTASTTTIDVYQICPAKLVAGNYELDTRFLLRIDAGMIVSAPLYGIKFRTKQVIDFTDSNGRSDSVYSVEGLNIPRTYLIKKSVQVTSGTPNTYTYTFGAPTKFSTITIPNQTVIEVIKVEDGNGYTWHEVDYLAQDLIFDEVNNTRTTGLGEESIAPYYILKLKKEPRRFVTRYNGNFYLELHFGSGVLEDTDSLINLDPDKIASDEYQTNQASTPLDPADFLSSRAYGLAPSNTTLTITYITGGGTESNVPSNSITKVDSVAFLNDVSGFTSAEKLLFADIQSSLAVENSESATGGKEADTVEELRQNALGFFNAQNRLVTSKDYITRCFAMPGKFGGVAKAFIIQDDQINAVMNATAQQEALALNPNAVAGVDYIQVNISPNVINLYVLGYNNLKKLTRLNTDTKNNIKKYLDQYRILTDQINILDAFVVNIGVNFSIVTYRNTNMNDVLARCISAIANFFAVENWDINEPIIINDLMLEIGQVEGVQTVNKLEIVNKYKHVDGSDYEDYIYSIADATDTQMGVIYPSLDPCIFELRYPDRDIIGNASQ